MTNPPIWSVELFRDYCSRISKYADKHGLPMPVTKKALIPICDLGKEYGQGFYGIVWPTEKEGVVFKITTDQTEAHFVKTAINLRESEGLNPQGIVEYYNIVAIPKKQLNRNLFMLWREEAASTNVADGFVGSGQFSDLLLDFKDEAQTIRHGTIAEFKKRKNIDRYWKWIDDELGDYDSWLSESLSRLRHYAGLMIRSQISKNVGEALLEYIRLGIIIADAHSGNVGRVFRGSKPPVYAITDPGQVVVLRRDLSRPEIEVIR